MKVQLVSPRDSGLATSAWTSLYDERLGVLRIDVEGKCVAEMFVYDVNKWGYQSLITPSFMPNTQLVRYSEVSINDLVEAIDAFCERGTWSYWKFDFPVGEEFAAGFPPTLLIHQKYTYRISELNNWRAGATSKLRNDINKMDRYTFEVSESLPSHFDFFERKLREVGLKETQILRNSAESNGFYFVEEREGRFVACCLLQGDTVYYLAAANEKADRTVATCGLAYCIDEALRRGARIFDFEGSMIPGVEAYFKKFGGDRAYYLSFSRGRGWKYRLRKLLRK